MADAAGSFTIRTRIAALAGQAFEEAQTFEAASCA
jgi:hypothetical protein